MPLRANIRNFMWFHPSHSILTMTKLSGSAQECVGAKLFLTGEHEADCVWARSSARLERQNSNVEAHKRS